MFRWAIAALFLACSYSGAASDVSKSAPERAKPVVQARLSDIGLGDPADEDARTSLTELPGIESAGLPAKELRVSFAPVGDAWTMPFAVAGSIKDLLEEAHHAGVDLPTMLKTADDYAALKAAAQALPDERGELKARLVAFANAISAPADDRFDALARFFDEHYKGRPFIDYRSAFSETPAETARRSRAKIKTLQTRSGMAIYGEIDEYGRLVGDLSLVRDIIRADLHSRGNTDGPFKLVIPAGVEPSSLGFEPDLLDAARSGRLNLYAGDGGPAFPADLIALPPVRGENPGVVVRERLSTGASYALEAAIRRVGSLPHGVTVIFENAQIAIEVAGREVYRDSLDRSEVNLVELRRSGKNGPATALAGLHSTDLSKRFEAALRLAKEKAEQVRLGV